MTPRPPQRYLQHRPHHRLGPLQGGGSEVELAELELVEAAAAA